jgi:hypothetical protein
MSDHIEKAIQYLEDKQRQIGVAIKALKELIPREGGPCCAAEPSPPATPRKRQPLRRKEPPARSSGAAKEAKPTSKGKTDWNRYSVSKTLLLHILRDSDGPMSSHMIRKELADTHQKSVAQLAIEKLLDSLVTDGVAHVVQKSVWKAGPKGDRNG